GRASARRLRDSSGRRRRAGRPPGFARRLLPRLRASRRPRGRVRVELARDPGPGSRPHTRLPVLADALPAPGPPRAEPPRGRLPAGDDPGLRGAAGPHPPRAFPLAASPLWAADTLDLREAKASLDELATIRRRHSAARSSAHENELRRWPSHAVGA